MDAATFYVRYLLAPTTLAAAAAALALLLSRLAEPLGGHAPTASLVGVLTLCGGWIALWEHLRPAERVWARRSPAQRRGDLRYIALTSAGVVACARLLTWVGATPEAIVASFTYQLVVGALQHSDLDIRLGVFNWIVPGPEMHRIHHHIDGAVAENYSLNLPALDLLFGTTAPCHGPGEVPMGVAGERD